MNRPPCAPSWLQQEPPERRGRRRRPPGVVIIDQVAIDRALSGDAAVHLTRAEKHEACRQGIARGLTWPEVQRVTRLSGQSITAALAEQLPAVDEPIGWWPTEHQLALAT